MDDLDPSDHPVADRRDDDDRAFRDRVTPFLTPDERTAMGRLVTDINDWSQQ